MTLELAEEKCSSQTQYSPWHNNVCGRTSLRRLVNTFALHIFILSFLFNCASTLFLLSHFNPFSTGANEIIETTVFVGADVLLNVWRSLRRRKTDTRVLWAHYISVFSPHFSWFLLFWWESLCLWVGPAPFPPTPTQDPDLDLDRPAEVGHVDVEGDVVVESEVELLEGEAVAVLLDVGPGDDGHLLPRDGSGCGKETSHNVTEPNNLKLCCHLTALTSLGRRINKSSVSANIWMSSLKQVVEELYAPSPSWMTFNLLINYPFFNSQNSCSLIFHLSHTKWKLPHLQWNILIFWYIWYIFLYINVYKCFLLWTFLIWYIKTKSFLKWTNRLRISSEGRNCSRSVTEEFRTAATQTYNVSEPAKATSSSRF